MMSVQFVSSTLFVRCVAGRLSLFLRIVDGDAPYSYYLNRQDACSTIIIAELYSVLFNP